MTERSLGAQFSHCIEANYREGVDKHSLKVQARAEGLPAFAHTQDKVLSQSFRDVLHDVSKNFGHWMKEHHPDVKLIRDIRSEHVNSYLSEKTIEGKVTQATLDTYGAVFRKLDVLVSKTYHLGHLGWKDDLSVPKVLNKEERAILRTLSMKQEHFDKVLANAKMYHSESKAVVGLEIAGRFGLRVSEIARLKVSDINYGKMELHVIGKGGRHRWLTITKSDAKFFRQATAGKASNDKVVGVDSKQINKMMATNLKETGNKTYVDHKTSIHAVRKMVAQRIWNNARNSGLSKMEAGMAVMKWLGHSSYRQELMDVYVEDR